MIKTFDMGNNSAKGNSDNPFMSLANTAMNITHAESSSRVLLPPPSGGFVGNAGSRISFGASALPM